VIYVSVEYPHILCAMASLWSRDWGA